MIYYLLIYRLFTANHLLSLSRRCLAHSGKIKVALKTKHLLLISNAALLLDLRFVALFLYVVKCVHNLILDA